MEQKDGLGDSQRMKYAEVPTASILLDYTHGVRTSKSSMGVPRGGQSRSENQSAFILWGHLSRSVLLEQVSFLSASAFS